MRPRTHGQPLHRGRSLRGWNAPDGIETFYEIRSRDSSLPPEEFARLPRLPVSVVLDNLRSAFNVGAVFRLCDAVRAAELITCGYTCHPPHHKLEQTSLGTDRSVPWRRSADTPSALSALKAAGKSIVGIETVTGAERYDRFDWPSPVAIVLGNEALGLAPEVLRHCDAVVEIPVAGYKNSLNVATAAAIILYEIARRADWFRSADSGDRR